MSKLETVKKLWRQDPVKVFEPIFNKLQQKGLLNWMSDKLFLKCAYRLRMGYSLNLKNPKTFNEKLQWLKLYDYKPEYDNLVDKYSVKEYIKEKIGSEYVVPTYGVWDSVDEIDWDSLPNQFVIKTTHGSGGLDVCICRDKLSFDFDDCKNKLRNSMQKNTYYYGRERPYKHLKPRIMAEMLLVDMSGAVDDYKVHNFNGIPEFFLVCRDRYSELGLSEDFFTDKWEHLDVKRPSHPNTTEEIKCPEELNTMLELGKQLSKGLPFVRTDFYVANSKLYFGELTFYPASGFVPFEPNEWDEKWGKLLTLPNEMGGGNLLIYNNIVLWLHNIRVDENKVGVKDYKFYCFNGEPRFLYVSQDLDNHEFARISFLTTDWRFAPFRRNDYRPLDELPQKPSMFEEMVKVAKKLSEGFEYLRVDLYEINNKIYFSELTFYPASGFMPFNPQVWDEKVGEMLNL